MKESRILVTQPAAGYELIDSGDGEKLERFGGFVLSRPDPQALWRKNDAAAWKKASGNFKRESTRGSEKGDGGWNMSKEVPARWPIDFGGFKFWIKPTAFKHTGLFPEQAANWEWLRKTVKAGIKDFPARSINPAAAEKIDSIAAAAGDDLLPTVRSEAENTKGERSSPKGGGDIEVVALDAGEGIEVLNLFGYTGGATLACAQAGAKVVHVDGSKAAITWARENAELSGLEKKPIRWILDDARAFVRREAKRGRRYDGIIMDPPAFGHGPDNELWKIEDHFLPLVEECQALLKDKPLFFLINGYSAGYSAIAYENNLLKLKEKFGGSIEIGELTLEEKETGRLLPTGIFARWSQ